MHLREVRDRLIYFLVFALLVMSSDCILSSTGDDLCASRPTFTRIAILNFQECFYREGVNHYRNCEELARAYVKRITSPNMRPGPVEMDDIPP